MNKYDSFSILHLELFIEQYRKSKTKATFDPRSNIIFWPELKEIIEKCNFKELK